MEAVSSRPGGVLFPPPPPVFGGDSPQASLQHRLPAQPAETQQVNQGHQQGHQQEGDADDGAQNDAVTSGDCGAIGAIGDIRDIRDIPWVWGQRYGDGDRGVGM